MRKLILHVLILTFFFTTLGPLPEAHAQSFINLPSPGTLVPPSYGFKPLELKGIQIYQDHPLRFDFLVDKGESSLYGQELKDEITRVTKYFLTCLTVPEKDLWVNLSPYEKDRIAPESFGVTEMGKSLLEQDYLLKQIMASLSYPENRLGQEFWAKVYRKSQELYGTTNLPVNTFNKVWITPKSAKVYVRGNGAFVVDSQLDVMLEADYKSITAHEKTGQAQGLSEYAGAYSHVIKEVILPQLRQEVNEGKNFAIVRQVYNSMILATWYKKHLKDSLLTKMYVGKNKVGGVDVEDKDIKEKIFEQYLKAYKKCVYNYVREDYDPLTQTKVARKYASGGMDFALFGIQGDQYDETYSSKGISLGTDLAMATVDVAAMASNGKILFPDPRTFQNTHPFKQLSKEISDKTMRALLPKLTLTVMLAMAGIGSASSARAAVYSSGPNSTVQITIQAGDTATDLIQNIRTVYSKIDREGYLRSPYVGSLYGSSGAIQRTFGSEAVSVGQTIILPSLPANVVKALNAVPSVDVPINPSMERNSVPLTVQHTPTTNIETTSATNDNPEEVITPGVITNPPLALLSYDTPPSVPSIEKQEGKSAWSGMISLCLAGLAGLIVGKFLFGRNKANTIVPPAKVVSEKDMPGMHVLIEARNGAPNATDEELKFNPALSAQMDELLQQPFVPTEAPSTTMQDHKKHWRLSKIWRPMSWWGGMFLAVAAFGFNPIVLLWAGTILSAVHKSSSNLFCGIIGLGRIGTVKELSEQGDEYTLQWMETMMRRLGFRGEHSAGLSTMIPDVTGKIQVPLEKDMKTKNGPSQNLLKGLFINYRKSLIPLDPNTSYEGFMLRLNVGHTRWATGGRVSINATHPHLGPLIEMPTWKYDFHGRLVRDTVGLTMDYQVFTQKDSTQGENNVVTASAGHNGDNDAYKFYDEDRWVEDLDELRLLFYELVHGQGEMPPGDSPPLPYQILYHLTGGNWFASARFAHTQVHHKTVDEIKKDILTREELKQAGHFFDSRFERFAHILSRPGLKKADKTLRDAYSDSQQEFIQKFRNYLLAELKQAVQRGEIPEKIYRHWSGVKGGKLKERFVDMAIERFFKGDRLTASQEFKSRSKGTYGVFFQVSTDINGITLISRKQGVVVGYDKKTREVAFASDTYAIQERSPGTVEFPDGRQLETLLYLNPAGEGEILDMQVSRHTGNLTLIPYSVEHQRYLNAEELKERHQRLHKDNVYYEDLPKIATILEDVKDTARGVFEARQSFEDPKSFNFRSAEEMLKRILSYWIEKQILDHQAYKEVHARVIERINQLSNECAAASSTCTEAQKQFLLKEGMINHDKDSLLMRMIARRLIVQARVLANSLITGDIEENDLQAEYLKIIKRESRHILDRLTQAAIESVHQEYLDEAKLPAPQHEEKGDTVDFLITGYEKSELIGQVIEEVAKALFPGLVTKAVNSNDILDYENESLHLNRLRWALIMGDFGSNFPDLDAANTLAHAIGMRNVFGMSSRIDSTLNVVLGQSLNEEAEFTNRIFVAGQLKQNEAATYSQYVPMAHGVYLIFHLARRMQKLLPHSKPFGLTISNEKDLQQLEMYQDSMLEDVTRATGYDETGHPIKNVITQAIHPKTKAEIKGDVHTAIQNQAKKISKRYLEVPVVNAIFWTYVVGIMSTWGGILGHIIQTKTVPVLALEGALTLSLGGFILPQLYRVATRWFHYDRFGAPSNISYVGRKGFHELQQLFYGIIFSLSTKSTGSQSHSADVKRNAISKLARLMSRGSLISAHIPSTGRMLGITKSSVGQLKVTKTSVLGIFKRFLSGGISFTTSRGVFNDPQHKVSDYNVVIGGTESAPDPKDPEISQGVRMVYDRLVDPWGGAVADTVRWAYVGHFSTFGERTRPLKTVGGAAAGTTQTPVPTADNQPELNRDRMMGAAYKGGIDMNSRFLDLTEDGKADQAQISSIGFAELEQIPINGLVPKVSKVIPVTPAMAESILAGTP